ncbi:MAG: ATP-binding protein [Chitinophagaceae bacterium]|nr:ATP-binding protein [Chitinophagaceae bacterium]
MILRQLEEQLKAKLHKEKAIILLGGRQTGKTTLLHKLTQNRTDTLWLNADEPDIKALIENATSTRLKSYFGKNKIIIIDEAQQVTDIGKKLKLITDTLKDIQVIATGSSAFEIKNKTNEPLTGRKWEFHLFPISFSEMVTHHGLIEEKRMIPHRLVYGYYPEVVTHAGEEKERLKLLSDSFLYKDILMYQGLKKPEKLIHLLKMLAANISSEINYNQLSKQLQLNNETVEKYIQLLEQCYIIFRMPAYATNLTKELKKGRKIYFTDNGIINSLTGNFSLIENRNDKGALWENFVISELYKQNEYKKQSGKFFFWRSHDQQEVDLVIQKNNLLETYEIKWSDKKAARLNKTFASNYPKHRFSFINSNNIEEFLIEQ